MPLDVEQLLEEQAEEHGINPVVLKSLVWQESAFNPLAKNKLSSASGLGQFIDSTWQDEAKRLGVNWPLSDRFDPRKNAYMTAAHVAHNIQRLGLDPSDPNSLGPAYLAHFRGLGGAREMLGADPNANVWTLKNWGAVAKANPFLRDAKTVGEAIEKIYNVVGRHAERFGGTATASAGSQEPPYQMVQGNVLPEEARGVDADITLASHSKDEIAQLLTELDAAAQGGQQADMAAAAAQAEPGDASNTVRIPDPNPPKAYREPSLITPAEAQRQEALTRQQPPQVTPPEEQGQIERLVRTGLAAIPRGVADIPAVGAMLTATPELMLKATGVMPEDKSPTYSLLETSANAHRTINNAVSIDEPRNPLEKAVEIGAQTLVPIARGRSIKGVIPNALEVATPFTIGGGKARAAANFGAQFLGHEALRPILRDENDPYQTIFDQFVFIGDAEASDPTRAAIDNQKVETTPGGPLMTRKELATLGLFGLATIGFAAGPHVWRRWAQSRVPTPTPSRRVDPTGVNAPMNLRTIENNRDLLKTYTVGPTEGLKSILERSGATGLDDLFIRMDTETHAGARTKVDTALATGRLDSYAGNYQAPIAPSRFYEAYRALPNDKKKLAEEYVLLHDILDDLNISGKQSVGGHTRAQVNQKISNIVRTFPEITDMHDLYKRIMQAGLEFASEGQFGMFSQKKKAELLTTRPNYVHFEIDDIPPDLPMTERMARRSAQLAREHQRLEDQPSFVKKREIASGPVKRTNPFEAMMIYTEQVMQAKMKNQLQGEIVDTLLASPEGKNSIVKVTREQLDKHPEWANRMFRIYRNGKPEFYVASQHIADTVRFDPLSARHTWAYAPARAFQISTTGSLNPLFSILPFIRDTQLGQINSPRQGVLDYIPGGRMPQAAWAVPRQAFPQMMKGVSDSIYRTLDSGEGGKVIRALTGNNETVMRGLADRMSHAYLNSFKYLIDSQGGINAALTQNAVQPAKTVFDEMVRNVELPYNVRQYASGWRHMLDAVQNGARFAYATRNLDPNMSKTEIQKILREAKELTGDVTKAGQVYNKFGKIGVDSVGNPLGKTALMAPGGIGTAQNFLLEASPFYNAMLKGIGRWGKAYVDNPTAFMAKTTSTLLLPTLASYGSAFSLGDEYVKYMMDLRGERDKALNLYIPIPGRPPEDGIEIPLPHEGAIMNYMFLTMLDHMSRGQQGDGQAAVQQGMSTLMDAVFDLTTPPVFQAAAASQGVKIDGGLLFGKDPYIPQENPQSHFNHNFELMVRALGGAAATVFINTTNAGIEGGLEGAYEEFKYQQAKKLPIVRDKQLTNFTKENDILWKKREQLDKILEVYGDHIDPEGMNKIRKRDLSVPKSMEGRRAVDGIDLPPNDMVGVNTPKPTNPVYLYFADEMKKRFGTNEYGFRSLVDRYTFFNSHLRALRGVNSGNMGRWWDQIKDNDEVKNYLRRKGITMLDRDAPRKIINEMYKDQHEVVERIEKQFADMEHRVQQAAKNNPRFLMLLKRHGIDPRSLEKFTIDSLDPYL